MGPLTEAQYKIIADRMIEEHRKYGDRLRTGHWADVAARKVACHVADFRKGERVFIESEVRAMLKAVRDELEANCRWQSGVEVVSASAMRQAFLRPDVLSLDPA